MAGKAVSSGLAAISAAVLGRVKTGETVITQRDLYGNSFSFFHDFAPRLGINVAWVDGNTADVWEAAFAKNPHAVLAYTETPANPTMSIIDLSTLSEVAHTYDAWVCVDNTFASPYHQRPLTRGCDIVIHSTAKFLTGHEVAKTQMLNGFGALISLELKGGYEAGVKLLEAVQIQPLR